ncbi:MAG: patatin-like phospholipase family protein [Bacteroidetes bacterium]|nr:patatin-like phospholipase family protein [Bacteroidota bacterium]
MNKVYTLSYKVCLAIVALFMVDDNQANAQKVGLVLSGGGVRAFAHIGVIKALEENNIPIDYITGTSGGALVGSLYACGYSGYEIEAIVTSEEFANAGEGIFPEEMVYTFLKQNPNASWITLKIGIDSVLRARVPSSIVNSAAVDFGLIQYYAKPIAAAGYNFDSLFVPFRCVASDIKSKSQVVFKDGDLGLAVRASMAFPFYFSSVNADGKIMFDGGMYNNFPVDVMLNEFMPDVVIGSSAAGPIEIPFEDNIISQTRTMLTQTTYYNVQRKQDFLVQSNVQFMDVFDFTKVKAAIDSGYVQTLRMIDSIAARIPRCLVPDERKLNRSQFHKALKPFIITEVKTSGVNVDQAFYIKSVVKPSKGPVSLDKIKVGFFRLAQDQNIKYVFPFLKRNLDDSTYTLQLQVRREKDLIVDFGGNFSSRPVNEGFVGVQYNFLGRQALSINGNVYFGKLYNAAYASLRVANPGRYNFYIEPYYSIGRWDYFRSSSSFFEDVKPSYLITDEQKTGVDFSIPIRNRVKVIGNAAFFSIDNKYFQSQQFSTADTADQTTFVGTIYGVQFERNQLNRKMYANRGSNFIFSIKQVQGRELTVLGTSAIVRDTSSQFNSWVRARVVWDNYFFQQRYYSLGIYSELMLSSQQFFANYTASILSAPVFEPTQESKTIFLNKFRAHNYVGLGIKNVFSINRSFDFRIEGYIFQPFQEILRGANDLKATYGIPFNKRYLIGAAYLVYNTPLCPISIGFNYYANEPKPTTFMFHVGYILFNRRVID